MDYLRLGELHLETSGGLSGFEETAGYNYATHTLATGKPTLQAIGETLSEVALNITLCRQRGHDIASILKQIDDLRKSATPQSLVFADGVFKGSYVITERACTVLRTTSSGTIEEAELTLSLKEYADRIVINRRNIESRQSTDAKSSRKVTVR